MLRAEGLVLPFGWLLHREWWFGLNMSGEEMQTYLVVMKVRHGWKYDTLFLETYIILPEHRDSWLWQPKEADDEELCSHCALLSWKKAVVPSSTWFSFSRIRNIFIAPWKFQLDHKNPRGTYLLIFYYAFNVRTGNAEHQPSCIEIRQLCSVTIERNPTSELDTLKSFNSK